MTTTDPPNAWRMVDVVVAAAVAVAFGIVFLAWNALYAATMPIFAFLPPAQAIMYGRLAPPRSARRARSSAGPAPPSSAVSSRQRSRCCSDRRTASTH